MFHPQDCIPSGRQGLGARSVFVAACVAACLGCSDPPPETDDSESQDAAHSTPRSDLLWPVDLSTEAVASMSRVELWSLGVEFLEWPLVPPVGLEKAAIYERLIDAQYRDVGDFGYNDSESSGMDRLGYSD